MVASGAAEVETRERREGAAAVGRLATAVVLAWLVPGLGHVVLGRIRRGLLFSAIVFTSFGLGLAHDGRLALRDPEQPVLTSLQVIANAGVGVADLAARFAEYGEAAYALPANRLDPVTASIYDRRIDLMRGRSRSGQSNFGTAYLWTAGLMNLLLLFDVWDIGRGSRG